MPLTIGTDTYQTLAEANAYFATQLHAQAWTAATEQDREAALTSATTFIDSLDYLGKPASSTQALAWPRSWVRNHLGSIEPPDEVPARVKQAQAHWALHLLKNDPAKATAPVIRKRVGDLELEYTSALADHVPATVRALLAPYLASTQNTARIVP